MNFVGVCGGRDFTKASVVFEALDRLLLPDDVVVHGGATGADGLAKVWCLRRGRNYAEVPALWKKPDGKLDRSAGHRRNAVIAALPLRLLVAFPGGPGTASMVEMARDRGIPVAEVPG